MKKLSTYFCSAILLALVICVSQQNSRVTATSLDQTIVVRDWTAAIGVDPAENFAYVATTGSWIEKVDLSSNGVVGSLSTNPYGDIRDIVVARDGLFAYVSSWSTNKVLQIDLANLTISAMYSVGVHPRGITITADSQFVYVANTESDSISKIAVNTGVVTSISVGTVPYDVSTDNNDFIYVVDAGGQISKVDVSSNTVVLTRVVGDWMTDLAINSATGYAYALQYAGTIRPLYKIQLSDLVKVAQVSVASGGVFVPANGLNVYTGHSMVRASNMQVLSVFETCSGFNNCTKASGVAVYGGTTSGDGYMLSSFYHVLNSSGYNKIRKTNVSLTQTITFSNPGNWAAHQNESLLFATASSGMSVTFTSNTQDVCQIYNAGGQRLRAVSLGTCSITASRASSIPGGSNYWDAAESVTQSFEIVASSQSITFSELGDQISGTRSVSLSATATSGLEIYYESLTPSICHVSLSGSQAVMDQVGSCSIRASQNGDWSWNQASPVTRAFNFPSSPQTINFSKIGDNVIPAALNILSGTKTVTLLASATSGFPVTFTSATTTICTVLDATVTFVSPGDCSINANQSGGSGWDAAPQVSATFTILPSPPVGEVGISIKNGNSYSNTKQVTLNLIWPEYATSARISNDGGFAASKTQTKDLAASIDWELDDSIKGIFGKVVYVRFNGVANTTQTYSDDIILDTSPPVMESSSAAAVSGSIDLTLKATDDITGVDKVQITNGTTTVTKDYATKVSVPLADLLLSVSSMGVQKLAATSIEVRVSDNAGNWSAYKALSVSGVVAAPTVKTPTVNTPTATTPTVSKSKSATAKSIAIFAKISVLPTSKVSLKVVSGYAKFCKVSGATLKGIKAGICKVVVTVTPKKGKTIPKTVTLKVTN